MPRSANSPTGVPAHKVEQRILVQDNSLLFFYLSQAVVVQMHE
jgi:hypothetical protein